MKLFGAKAAKPAVAVEPSELLPTGELTALLTIPEPLDKVSSARVELGYVNTYNYRWAGKADAALTQGADSLANVGQVGTDYGSERETSDWVSVLVTDLHHAGGTLAAGERRVPFRVPSWAPGSSPGGELVGWAVRLTVERKGRDIETDGVFTVLAPPPASPPPPAANERIMGGSTDIDIRLDRPAWRAGETMTGTIVITSPEEPLPEADIAVALQFDRLSHPLERTPGQGQTFDRERVSLGKQIALTPGGETELPFAIVLPAQAPPTAEAVHGSIAWFVLVRILYKGFNAHMPERVRRGFVAYNAD